MVSLLKLTFVSVEKRQLITSLSVSSVTWSLFLSATFASPISAGQFILKLGGIGFLSTYTGISRTASTAGCLFTLKTKHFFVHVSILRFSYFEI